MAKVIVNPHVDWTVGDLPPPVELPFSPPETPQPSGVDQYAAIRDESVAEELEEAAQPTRSRWLGDPTSWVVERLHGYVWSVQRSILESIRDHESTAVHTCHNIGKSWTAAQAVCWWLDVHEPGTSFVVTTAPTGSQVKAILWRYINRLHQTAGLVGRVNLTEWYIGNELVAYGRKPSEYQPDAFQGIHAAHVLVVLDEACGIPDVLWDAASTLTSNRGSRTLAIGNPDDPQSRFARVAQPGSGWNVISVGAEDTPNFTGESVPSELADSLISPEWAEKKRVEWGVDSPLFQSKVMGKFPVDAEDGVAPASYVTPCRYLADAPLPDTPHTGGIDVGETTDRTVIFERVGGRVGRHVVINHHGDAMTAVGQLVGAINEWGLTDVTVDVIGLGWGVYSRLRELSRVDNPTDPSATHSAHVQRFSAGEQSTEPERFFNKRAELWWNVARERSREQMWDLSALDDDVVAELTCPRYRLEGSKGRIIIESKDEIRKRLGRSPDLADALLMAFWEGDPVTPPAAFPAANRQLASMRL